MKFWTVQNKYTLDKIIEDGIYHPDINFKSEFVVKADNAYNIIKRSYELMNNNIRVTGLVFGLTQYMGNPITSYDEYKHVIADSGAPGISISENDFYVLELEVPDNINLASCQFYNFADLLYYLDLETEYYDYNEKQKAINDLFSKDSFLDLVQSHIHYIDKSMIKNIYKSYNYHLGDIYGECKDLEYYKDKILNKEMSIV